MVADGELFDFSEFPLLTTERLVLCEPTLAHAADVLVLRGDYEVQKFNGPVISTLAEAEAEIRAAREEYDREEGITWAVAFQERETTLGHFAFHEWSRYHRHAVIGYDLARAYWGQGIASEALRAMLRFGFERLNLHRVHTMTIADNHASVRLLERLGFTREGTRREHSWEDDGTFHDSALFGLLRREFLG